MPRIVVLSSGSSPAIPVFIVGGRSLRYSRRDWNAHCHCRYLPWGHCEICPSNYSGLRRELSRTINSEIEAISCCHDLLGNVKFGPILNYMEKYYFVYIMTNKHNTVLYTGVTNNLVRKVFEHKEKLIRGFTEKYKAVKLVYYEIHEDRYSAISRKKQIKGGSRQKKIELVNEFNKDWKDLYGEICS